MQALLEFSVTVLTLVACILMKLSFYLKCVLSGSVGVTFFIMHTSFHQFYFGVHIQNVVYSTCQGWSTFTHLVV